jgi:hypothetical protein
VRSTSARTSSSTSAPVASTITATRARSSLWKLSGSRDGGVSGTDGWAPATAFTASQASSIVRACGPSAVTDSRGIENGLGATSGMTAFGVGRSATMPQ